MGIAAGVMLGQPGREVGGEAGVVAGGAGGGLEDVDVVEGCHAGIVARDGRCGLGPAFTRALPELRRGKI